MIAEEDEKIDYIIDEEEEIDPKKIDYTHITKHPYLNKIFCWIESGNTQAVKNFFDTFPHLLDNFLSPNNWNPFMYAVRYGNMELIDYFREKSMKPTTQGILNIVSIVHAAVYSGQVKILQYILNEMKIPANPIGCEISPLKVAMKANNVKMVELLVAKGGFYVFGNVFNNVQMQHSCQGQKKYTSLATGKDLNESLVVQDTAIKGCPIKETLRYARVRPIVYMKKLSEVDKKKTKGNQNKKLSPIADILIKQHFYEKLLKIAVGKGESVLQIGAEDGKQKK